MEIKRVEDGIKELEDDRRKDYIQSNRKHQQLDPGSALQTFLDRIPISSIPSIQNSPGTFVVELKSRDSVKDAIQLLYEKIASCAPIVDDVGVVDPDVSVRRFSDRYMGFIDFVSLILWSLEECEKAHIAKDNVGDETSKRSICSFFDMLEHSPEIGQTKAVPVVQQSDFQVIGFVKQNAVIQLLLQSRGLAWFDRIADKALSKFRFESEERVILVHADQSQAEALHILCVSRMGAVAVVNRETEKIIGCFRSNDVYLLLENNELFNSRKSLTMGEFIHMETAKAATDPTMEQDPGALFAAGVLRLGSSFSPRMYSSITAKTSDRLKQVMSNLAETEGSFCFLVDD